MKHSVFYIVLLCTLFTLSNLQAQVQFDNFPSYEKLISKAKKDKKLIFVQLNAATCNQCNEVAQKGLSSTLLKEKYALNFIAVSVKKEDEIFKQINEKNQLENFNMGSIFLDADGLVLRKINSTNSDPTFYLELADKAIELSKNNPLKELELKYKNGDRSKELLRKIIEERNKFDIEAYELVNEYLQMQTLAELSTIEMAKFITEQALPLNNIGRKLLLNLFSKKTVDSLFFTYSLKERVNINNRIIQSTNAIAMKNKDKALAYQIGSFIENVNTDGFEKGSFKRYTYLLSFFEAIKDTTAYLRDSQAFCDYLLMNVSVDNLKKREDKERNAILNSKKKEQNSIAVISTTYTSFFIGYARQLNNVAFSYYKYTNNSESLAKALTWSKRAIEIYETLSPDVNRKQNPMMMDTYACLLYKTGKKEEAIQWQTNAVETLKKYGEESSSLENTLDKMKRGVL